jgi:hypothetical protein
MRKFGIPLGVISITLSFGFVSSMAVADVQPWPYECVATSIPTQANSIHIVDRFKLLQLSVVTKRIKTLSKSEKEIVKQADLTLKKMSELSNFNCDTISETFWNEIKNERIKNISEVNSQAVILITQLQAIQGQTITCYRDGGTRTIVGKNPECPKGFVKTR